MQAAKLTLTTPFSRRLLPQMVRTAGSAIPSLTAFQSRGKFLQDINKTYPNRRLFCQRQQSCHQPNPKHQRGAELLAVPCSDFGSERIGGSNSNRVLLNQATAKTWTFCCEHYVGHTDNIFCTAFIERYVCGGRCAPITDDLLRKPVSSASCCGF